MERYYDCPQVLREFLTYHDTIKGQSPKTIQEYYLDLRMFLRFMVLTKKEMPYQTDLDTISIKHVDLRFIGSITVSDIFDFLSYLANDRVKFAESPSSEIGIGNAARARKLSAIKSFYKYLTVRTKQLDVNPVQDFEFPKIRKSLPKYLTLEESKKLLKAVEGPNAVRDFAILMIFLNCGIRRAELVGLNISDISDDRIRVVGKGTGSLTIQSADSNKTWTFTDIDEYVDIDSEQMNCYKGAEPMNDTVAGDGFPTLDPGENTFSFSGGINGISVFPRWCSI